MQLHRAPQLYDHDLRPRAWGTMTAKMPSHQCQRLLCPCQQGQVEWRVCQEGTWMLAPMAVSSMSTEPRKAVGGGEAVGS